MQPELGVTATGKTYKLPKVTKKEKGDEPQTIVTDVGRLYRHWPRQLYIVLVELDEAMLFHGSAL